ncbi:MAG: alkaline phosphatase family protein [Candidatus Aminicenantes bacterium]|jgi:predicted AlkP superfamily phosphohydrolase/phosphomutase
MGIFKRKKKNRVCVIGLDGVPYSLIQDLAQHAVMPSFAQLIETGSLQKMKASLPEISAVSWTDFMTGSNSGTHGIFGFTDLKDNSYDLRFPNFSSVRKETFWDVLGRMNKKSFVINQPSTYPARAIEGILISGFVALELSKAVYPRTLKSTLSKMDYRIDIDTFKSRTDHNFLWNELDKTLSGRQKAFDYFWEKDWDYFELVLTGTDRLHHYLWDSYEDKNHIFHQRFLDYYRQIDVFLEKIVTSYLDLNRSLEGLYLLSDHGFTGLTREVFLNAWLEKEGYLSFSSPSPAGLQEIDPRSRAFAMDPNRIYIHSKDKYPNGCVDPAGKSELKAEITEKLERLEYQGQRVVRNVFDTDEIYSGPYTAKGPDLIVLSTYGFDMKGSVKKKEIFGQSNLRGMHTWDDAFFWSITQKETDLAISDLSSRILSHFL